MFLNYKNDPVWFLTFFVLYLALSFVPVAQNFSRAPKDTFYYGGEHYPLDMVGNLATVMEGYNGNWLRTSKFTSTIVGPPTIVKFEYILVGQTARLLRMDPLTMFYLVRLMLTFVYAALIFVIVRHVFPSTLERVVAYTLVFFATGIRFPWQPELSSIIDQMLYDSMPFNRLTLAAHHYLSGSIFALVSLYFLAKAIRKPNTYAYFLVSAATIFITSFLYAPNTLVAVLSVGVVCGYWMVRAIVKPAYRRPLVTKLSICFVYAIVAVLPMIYIQTVISRVWDWTAYAKTENLTPFDISVPRYLYAVGVVYVFAIIGAIGALRRKNLFLLFLAPWVIIHPLSEFVLAPLIHINRVRFFLSMYFVVYGILATAGAGDTAAWLIRITGKKLRRFGITALLVACILAPSFWTYEHSFKIQRNCFCLDSMYAYAYPKTELMDTIWWLRANTKEHDVVMSGFFAGTLIPAFAGNDVYTSWWFRLAETPNFNTVVDPMVMFYRNQMTDTEAADFMKRNNISYVLYAQEEQALFPNQPLQYYPWFHLVAQFGNTLLYKVDL